jgi:hypothetical protein
MKLIVVTHPQNKKFKVEDRINKFAVRKNRRLDFI